MIPANGAAWYLLTRDYSTATPYQPSPTPLSLLFGGIAIVVLIAWFVWAFHHNEE